MLQGGYLRTFCGAGLLALILFAGLSARSQSVSSDAADADDVSDPAAVAASPTPTPAIDPEMHRWLDVDTLSLGARYRLIRSRIGVNTADQAQWQLAARLRFKFDKNGKYSVNVGTFTGNAITSGWNSLGPGTGAFQSNLFVKQLYFDAKPIKGLEFQFGGIGVNNGVNTEITGYDNDVYITGERMQLRFPKQLYFDEISVTYAYFNTTAHPSVFRRFRYLDKSNYHQFLARKQVNKHFAFSGDYTFEQGRDTFHEAVQYKFSTHRFLDSLLYENYQRVSADHGFGFAVSAEKTVTPRLSLIGGFAHIDRPLTNGDRFPQGDRVYLTGSYKLTRELSLGSAIIRGVGELPVSPTTVKTRFEILLQYNVLQTLHRMKIY